MPSPPPLQGGCLVALPTQGGARGLACPGLIYFRAFGAAGGTCPKTEMRPA